MIYLKQIFFQMLIIKKEIGRDEWVNEISSYIWAPENGKRCIRIIKTAALFKTQSTKHNHEKCGTPPPKKKKE